MTSIHLPLPLLLLLSLLLFMRRLSCFSRLRFAFSIIASMSAGDGGASPSTKAIDTCIEAGRKIHFGDFSTFLGRNSMDAPLQGLRLSF